MVDEAKNINTTVEENKTEEAKKPTKKTTRKTKTLKDKVCEILNITEHADKERIQGGVCKFYDLGNIPGSLLVPTGKFIRNSQGHEEPEYAKKFVQDKKIIVKEAKDKLKQELGEQYKYLTIEIKLFKPKFGATRTQCLFKVGIYVYGPDFPRIIKQVGKNKNIKIIT